MMIRSLLLSSALVTGVVTGFSGEALAQRGMTLKPADSWSVAKYDGPEANGDAYCAVARRFDRSTIVTIAKNTKNESSLAVDFQSQRLNPNNVLSVSLDPGAAQMREFEIFPASEKAFVLRLGRDEDFFDALARTGHLRAEIGSKAFNFDMADVGSGYSALGKCLDSVQKSLASGQRANPSSGQPAALRADEMQGGVFNDAPSASSLAAAPVPSVPAVSTGNGEVDALVRRIEDLERRNGDLNTQLARVSGQSAGSVRQLEEITVLKQENERIRTSLMDARSGAEQVHDLRMELEQLKAKNYVMEQDLAVARTGEGEASVLQERVRSLTTALDDVKAERDAAQAKLAQLELEQSMLRERAAQGDAVRGERLGLMEQQVNALQERIALMTSTIEEKDTAIMALNEQVREAESLRLANAEMQAEIAAQAPVFDGPGDVGFDASSFQPNQLSATRKISDMIENGDQVDEGFVALPADMMAPLPSLESEPQSETARIEPEIDDALLDSTLDTEEEFMMPDSPPEDMLAEPEPAFEPAPRDEPVRAAARAAPQPLYRYRAEAGAYELESAPDYAALPDAPMAAADAAAARNVAAVQPASSSSRYRAVRGADVRETLDFWSRDAGVALMWLPDWVADVRETVDVSNSYENAVQALLDQYGNINGGRVVGTLYVDPATKQKTLVVEHKS